MLGRAWVLLAGCALAVLAGGCASGPAEMEAKEAPPTGVKVALGFRPKAGDKATVVWRIRQVSTQTRPGEPEETSTQETYGETECLIRGTDGGGMSTVRLSYQRLQSGGPMWNGDSAGGGTGIPDRIYKALCKKEFEVDYAANGGVQAVRGLAALYDAMGAAVPELEAAQRDELVAQMKGQFGEEAMKAQLATRIYPDHPVDNGDTWRKVTRVANYGVEVASEYTLLEHDATTATIGVKGTMTPVPMAEPLHVWFLALRYSLTGTVRGTIRVDLAEGWKGKVKLVQNYSGTVEGSGPGISGTQRWPIKMETTTTMETR